MTQEQQDTTTQQDALMDLWADVRSQRQRLDKIAEPTPRKVLSELSDTGLSAFEDMLGYLVNFRNYVSESLQDVDSRLSILESDAPDERPLLGEEEAAMILALCATCEAFNTVIRETSASITDEALAKLDETAALVEQVRAWVQANVDDGSDDGDDDLPDDEDAGADEATDAEG